MRYLLLALLLAFATPATAQTCTPVEPLSFIAAGLAALQSGESKGDALTGVEAADFGQDAEIEPEILAVFMLEVEDKTLILRVDATTACIGDATDEARALFLALRGQPT